MLQDLRTAVRAILKDRWLAAAAVFALALGIGVNATVFTLVNAVLIRGLPFHDSANLYVVRTRLLGPDGVARTSSVSYQELLDWRLEAQSFTDMGAFCRPSSGVKSRPMSGCWPSRRNRFSDTRAPVCCSGIPLSSAMFIGDCENAAMSVKDWACERQSFSSWNDTALGWATPLGPSTRVLAT